jgi:hypothetical protein
LNSNPVRRPLESNIDVNALSSNRVSSESADSVERPRRESLSLLASVPSQAGSSSGLAESAQARREAEFQLGEVARLLQNGGMKVLRDGLASGFESLGPDNRDLGMQIAGIFGMVQVQSPVGSAMTPAQVRTSLEDLAETASQAVAKARPNEQSALGQSASQRIQELTIAVAQLRRAGGQAKANLDETSGQELLKAARPGLLKQDANGNWAEVNLVVERLSQWHDSAAALHEEIERRFGPTHPLTVAAQLARTEASAAYAKTTSRMVRANVGNVIYKATLGPLLSGVSRLFGMGN